MQLKTGRPRPRLNLRPRLPALPSDLELQGVADEGTMIHVDSAAFLADGCNELLVLPWQVLIMWQSPDTVLQRLRSSTFLSIVGRVHVSRSCRARYRDSVIKLSQQDCHLQLPLVSSTLHSTPH